MAKLELPVRSYIESYVSKTFPLNDLSRGSAINDLVIKPLAISLQPFRHEVDVAKVNSSVSNYAYMTQKNMDALAANWGVFRQTGGKATGTVRLYFNSPINYTLNYLEAKSNDGVSFVLTHPVTIASTDLLKNQLSSTLYYYDTTMQSIGIGSRFFVPAGSIATVLNPPPGLVRVENIVDFTVTVPDQSNYDLLNTMYRNLGLRNLVSASSIRYPLLSTFPSTTDVFVAGAGHPKMLRDVVAVNGSSVHVGGCADIWINTNSVTQKVCDISYVPVSGNISLVTEAQASENRVIYSFSREVLDLEGRYYSQDNEDELDESSSLFFNSGGMLREAAPTGYAPYTNVSKITTGFSSILPTSNVTAVYDPSPTSSLDNVLPGDILRINTTHYKITATNGLQLELAPPTTLRHAYSYTTVTAMGMRQLTIPAVNAQINDTCSIATGDAAGQYRVLRVEADSIYIGNVVSKGTVTSVSNGSTSVLNYTGTNATISHWVYVGTNPGAFVQSSGWYRITDVARDHDIFQITVAGNTGVLTDAVASLVEGLRGELGEGDDINIEYAGSASVSSPYRQAQSHLLYINTLEEDLEEGATTLTALNLGHNLATGDCVVFESEPKVSVLVEEVSAGSCAFKPSLPLTISAGTRYSIQRNRIPLSTCEVTAVNTETNSITINPLPLGLGEGVGYLLKFAGEDELFTVVASTAAQLRTLKLQDAHFTTNITLSASGYVSAGAADIGKTVIQQVGNATYVGVLTAYNNSTRVWTVQVNDEGADTFTAVGTPVVRVIDSIAIGSAIAVSAFVSSNFTAADNTDIGKIVRQGVYTGLLVSQAANIWQVKPLSDADVFNGSVEITIDDGVGHGFLNEPASDPIYAAGPATLTLKEELEAYVEVGAEFDIYPRFPYTGCLNIGGVTKIFVEVNPDVFDGVEAGDLFVIPAGPNNSTITITGVDANELNTSEVVEPDLVVVPGAPAAQTLTIGSPLAPADTLAATNIGVWAQKGRVLKLVVNGTAYYLPISGPISQDSLQLAEDIPLTLYPTQTITYEILTGFCTPYSIVDANSTNTYSIHRPPSLGETIYIGSSAYVNGGVMQVNDNTPSFTDILNHCDFTAGDYELYITSGAYASTIPYVITAVPSANSVIVTGTTFNTDETDVSYYILRKNNRWNSEAWVGATISSDGVTVELDESVDFVRHGTGAESIACIQSTAGSWVAPALQGTLSGTTFTPNITGTSYTASSVFTGGAFAAGYRGTRARVLMRLVDRTMVSNLVGSAVNTYNYYSNTYFSAPLVRIQKVETLNAATQQIEGTAAFTLNVNGVGTRYSSAEDNSLSVVNAAGKPLRITYLADDSISEVNAFINAPATRVINCNTIVKRMETIYTNLTASVRSEKSADVIAGNLAAFINTVPSTQSLSKDIVIKYLYDNEIISYIDVGSFVLGGVYYENSGRVHTYTNVSEIFGAETACYLAGAINITKV